MNDLKQCSECKEWKPLSAFQKRNDRKSGLRSACKTCNAKRKSRWNGENKDRVQQYNLEYRTSNREILLKKRRDQYAEHPEVGREQTHKWYWNNISKARAISRNRANRHRTLYPEKIRIRKQHWYSNNREIICRKNHARYVTNPEPYKERARKRRAQKASLPDIFTGQDWRYALNWWHSVCAYCGNGPSLFDLHRTLHMDHFIPLTSPNCPGTIPANMVPACQSCNLAKHNRDALAWLTERFGPRKAKQIASRIQDYFDSLEDKP